jgi:tRNA nucleotidyltransferase (CCA-adding enzyme)
MDYIASIVDYNNVQEWNLAEEDASMHIILTHEQADFDALASLLGAHLTNEVATPVLPRKLNRNVRAFITLYGMELPFVDPRDLPNEPIDKVTLVDTQSMISVKGMQANAQIQVIDHHPSREESPANWKVTTEETGATATIFAEVLREQDYHLSAIEATLMLLGIYEDTGSLTYTRTTARDLNAVSYLLERGASLEIAADFLNHPLSIQQQELYDQLRTSAAPHHIHGHTVMVACGGAQDMEEELSTVAHKLRDLLDPEALFVLVTTRGGVQLIARSTNEDIDVAQISDQFGGGGHERAAAALIRDRDLESVCQELLEILPKFIRPAITVAEIMSRGPQLLSPDTSVQEAATRMQRFGYEGYPVVDQDSEGHHHILGLLTRREVDRAISHKLNLTAASLMNAGQVKVHPGDSIEHLQRLMTDTGWGQIPVINPATDQVIGIVTRTDLLKTLTPQPEYPQPLNLANRLETALPTAHLILLKAVANIAYEQHAALYIVGGFVRDLLLDRPSLDFDLVVEGNAIQLAQALAKKYGGRVTSHSRFGTSKWHISDIYPGLIEKLAIDIASSSSDKSNEDLKNPGTLPESLDLITARTEFYTYPTALPTVERGSIKLDLHRRDFTINTLALRLDGHHYAQLHDYWGGLNDLNNGLVRVLHSLSFVDDPTRMLRAVRFEQRFNFQIESRTLELIKGAIPLLERVSGDRIRHELDRILGENNAHKMLARLDDLNLLTAIQSDLIWDDWISIRIKALTDIDPEPDWRLELTNSKLRSWLGYILWLIRLPPIRSQEVIRRLKLPSSLADNIISAQELWNNISHLRGEKPSSIVSRLDTIQPLAIYANYLASQDELVRNFIWDYVSKWRNIVPHTDGHTLRQLGLPPGPVYRQILRTLRNAWLDGKIDSLEEEKSLLEKLLSKG